RLDGVARTRSDGHSALCPALRRAVIQERRPRATLRSNSDTTLPMPRPELTIERLTTTAEVHAFADEARSEGRLALDTEFIWEKTYAPIPCLVQVATSN